MKKPIAFNFTQCVFTLNMFANLVSDTKDKAEVLTRDLDKMLHEILDDQFVQQKMGAWQIVWGPVVGSYGSDATREYASNALYLAVNQDGQYVLATSATNPASLYGWFVEDFDVHTMVPWPGTENDTNPPMISSGTDIGMQHLLAMKHKDLTIIEFLKATFGTSTDHTQIVVTGHSLGGAQSAVLALYIDEHQKDWNPAGTAMVCVEPSAGASPGNKTFSNYYNKTIGPRTQRFWNSLDPVPHGWVPDLLEMVPFLYYPYLKPTALFKGVVALVLSQSLEGTSKYPGGGFYTQIMPQTPPLPGQVDLTETANLPGATVLQSLVDIGIGDILKKLGVGAIARTLIVDAVNIFLKEYAGENTIDVLMQELEARLQKILGHEPFFAKLLAVIENLLMELENILLFLIQLAAQHVTAYPYLMGTASMHPLSESIINTMTREGKLDTKYKNVVTRLNDPKQSIKLLAPKIGPMLLALLTDDFIAKSNLSVPTA